MKVIVTLEQIVRARKFLVVEAPSIEWVKENLNTIYLVDNGRGFEVDGSIINAIYDPEEGEHSVDATPLPEDDEEDASVVIQSINGKMKVQFLGTGGDVAIAKHPTLK